MVMESNDSDCIFFSFPELDVLSLDHKPQKPALMISMKAEANVQMFYFHDKYFWFHLKIGFKLLDELEWN